MRIERLTFNKIKIFLTSDDLSERGLTKEDIWKDSLKWHQLFHEMLEEASEELGVNFQGAVAVEIFSIHAQGMIMIVTKEDQEDELLIDDGFINMQVTDQSNNVILFEFTDIEEVIQLSKRLASMNFLNGTLYFMNQTYFFFVKEDPLLVKDGIIANMCEYGNASLESIHRLNEYGTVIIKEKAVETLVKFF